MAVPRISSSRTDRAGVAWTVALCALAVLLQSAVVAGHVATVRVKSMATNGQCDTTFGTACDIECGTYKFCVGTNCVTSSLPEVSDNNNPSWSSNTLQIDFAESYSGSFSLTLDCRDNDPVGTDGDAGRNYIYAIGGNQGLVQSTLSGFGPYITTVYVESQITCNSRFYGTYCDEYCLINDPPTCKGCSSATGYCSSCSPGYTDKDCLSKVPNWCSALPTLISGSGSQACTLPNNVIDTVCTVSCNAGFTASSAVSSVTCNGAVQGPWSATLAVCNWNDNYCPARAAPPNGAISCPNQNRLDATCTFSCATGYALQAGSPSSIKCNQNTLATGVWSNAASGICSVVDNFCQPLPSSANLNIAYTALQQYRSVASFSCATGYVLSATGRTANCSSTTQWSWSSGSSAPTCSLQEGFCTALVAPTYGSMSCTARATLGSTCSFACDNGYVLASGAAASSTCQPSTSWTYSAPTCVIKDAYCATPALPDHATLVSISNTINGKAVYACSQGYTQTSGDTQLVCSASTAAAGTFTGTTPVCSIASTYCAALASVPSGMTPSCTQSSALGSVCTFSCQAGYVLSGASSTTCNANGVTGSWSNANPTCVFDEAYCPTPATFTSGAANCGSHPRRIGTTCTYDCNAGYINDVSTPTSATCVAGGTWSLNPVSSTGAPSCIRDLAYCPNQQTAPDFGSVICSESNALGSTCTHQCSAGYVLSGPPSSTCQPSRGWSSAKPSCTVVATYCPSIPVPANGASTCTGAGASQVCTFSCNAGYKLDTGSTTTSCRSNATWSTTPATACVLDATFCPALSTPTSGTLTPSCPRSIASVCYYGCNAGYRLVGDDSTACTAAGTWDPVAPTCQLIDGFCAATLLSPTNGHVSCTGTGSVGSSCTFTCDAGYTLSGSATSSCTSLGQWSSVEPTCVPIEDYCANQVAPPFSSGIACTRRNTVGSTCSYSCVTGYEVAGAVGSNTIACNSGNATVGSWSAARPSCTSVANFCPALTAPVNGSMVCTAGRQLNSACSFSCSSGFVSSTAASAQCLSTGLWNGAPSTCQLIESYCNPAQVVAPDHGTVTCTARGTLGSKCAFTCDTGYTLSHPNSTTCSYSTQFTGSWSIAVPSCQLNAIHCPAFPIPASGSASCDRGRSLGSICLTACSSGFFVSNNSLPYCTVDATWSAPGPSCVACLNCNGNGQCMLNATTQSTYCQCNPGFTGANCNQCLDGRFGPTCAFCPACQNTGVCNSTITGDGRCVCPVGFGGTVCTDCQTNYFGPSCTACPSCGLGTCNATKSGNGVCRCPTGVAGANCEACAPNYYGSSCTHCPFCGSGTCNATKAGDGACVCQPGFGGLTCETCLPGFFGSSCTACPSCDHGTCRDGFSSDGTCVCDEGFSGALCDECLPGRFGPSCLPCPPCYSGTCNGGIDGDGQCECPAGFADGSCDSCLPDHYGRNCTACAACGSPNTCNSGYSGDGSCVCAGGYAGSSCENCAPGRYGPTCLPCPPCLYGTCNSTKTGNGQCVCNAGFTGSNCQACQNGYFGVSCTACPNCNTGTCNSGISGSGKCSCTAPYTGERCELCLSGYYLPANSSTCVQCEPGYSCNNSTRTACAPGTMQPNPGRVSCTPCSIGFFQSNSSSTECKPCVAGFAQDQPGQSSCQPCPFGQYSVGNPSGTSACTQCLAGTHQDRQGQSDCALCGSGLYQDDRGMRDCKACDPGFVPAANARSCVPCEPGFSQPIGGEAECSLCDRGTAQSQYGHALCDECGPGYEAPDFGQQACGLCDLGKYSSGTRNVRCTSCPVNTYQDTQGQSSCDPCPANSTTLTLQGATSIQQCICDAGFRWEATLLLCMPCDPGSKCQDGIQTSCLPGQYQPNPARSSCRNCPAGSISTTAGAIACDGCGTSQFQALAGQTFCDVCPELSSHSLGHQTSILSCVCNPGYLLNADAATCDARDCLLPIPTKGLYANCTAGTRFPAECSLSCISGFRTVYASAANETAIQCSVHGNWTTYLVSCAAIADDNGLAFGPGGQFSVAAIVAISLVLILLVIIVALGVYRKRRYGHIWAVRASDDPNMTHVKGAGFVPSRNSSSSLLNNKVFLAEEDLRQMPVHVQAALLGVSDPTNVVGNPLFETPDITGEASMQSPVFLGSPVDRPADLPVSAAFSDRRGSFSVFMAEDPKSANDKMQEAFNATLNPPAEDTSVPSPYVEM
ncbi:keratin-associated protein 5-4 [Capsaspora owczarzaki ATCC 30864]|uniref:Keratin-associated protein 5-4 n=1 Tax=Capsaspora owczarzaki (strain ATCC 30864) TaxID=595528 RepID=A0A0D2WT54_CAPO3|nr:keratin-associated protein 5-4 [Capsaspora owczarzaki ATCC 30864]KJE94763.1 keratin-associated protein 5-4 [Capsaspora owczarzaki ATCC 30864]|eukprot:XP_004347036.2 keratin-associated protein 5-4 [Capsaspora owczarzaki ATCC 30864]